MYKDRITKAEKLALLIPAVIETEQSHTGLLLSERLKIAEELLDKCVIIVKDEHNMKNSDTKLWFDEGSLSRRCMACGCKNTYKTDYCEICGNGRKE